MSERQPNWQDEVRRGLFHDEVFTGSMKKSVLNVVDHPRRYAWPLGKKLAGAAIMGAAIVLLLLYGLPGNAALWNDNSKQAGGAATWPVSYQLLDAPILQQGEVVRSAGPDILPGLSNSYSPWRDGDVFKAMPLTELELLDQKLVEGFGTVLHYTLVNGTEMKYGTDEKLDYFGFIMDGVSEPGTFFHIGLGHMYTWTEHSLTRLFGYDVLKVEQRVCRTDGEECVWYFAKDTQDDLIHLMFEAKTYERDLDGDGVEEIIVTTVKQNQIYIFKEKDGQLLWASIRDILEADKEDKIAYHDADGTFSIEMIGSNGVEASTTYRYADGKDRLVSIDR